MTAATTKLDPFGGSTYLPAANAYLDPFGGSIVPASSAEPANLSLGTATTTVPTEVTLGATTDVNSGTAYAIVTASGDESAPTNTEVIDGTAPEELFRGSVAIGATGAFTLPSIVGLTPGNPYGYVVVHDIAGSNDAESRVEGTFTAADAYGESASYVGGTPPDDSIVCLATGTHTGVNNAATLTDATKSFTVDELIGAGLDNETDLSTTTVTDNTATTLVGTLTGGTDADWDTNDAYKAYTPLAVNDLMYCEATIVVANEAGSLKFYHYVATGPEYTKTGTLSLTLTGYANGTYDVALATDGTITLTLQAGENGEGSSEQVLGGGGGDSGGWYYKYYNAAKKNRKRRGRRN